MTTSLKAIEPAYFQYMPKLEAQIVGNIGLYYVSYRLSQLGWNVMPTARNAKGIDLVAYDLTCNTYRRIQVKSLSKRDPVPLGTNLDKVMGDYWVIVNKAVTEPQAFVMKPEEVKDLAHRGERSGRVSYWLQPKSYDTDEFREAWGRIEFSDYLEVR